MKTLTIFYWILFVLSIITLFSNFGLVLFGFGIVIVPILILHINVGLKINSLIKHRWLITASSFNLFFFTMIRPEGVHVLGIPGVTSVLNFIGVHIRLNHNFIDFFCILSLILLLVQVLIDSFICVAHKR